jgi:hypothetical protein
MGKIGAWWEMINNLYGKRCERSYNPTLWPDRVTSLDQWLKPKGNWHGVHNIAQGQLAVTFLCMFNTDRNNV